MTVPLPPGDKSGPDRMLTSPFLCPHSLFRESAFLPDVVRKKISVAFWFLQSDESSCAKQAQKRTTRNNMTNADTTTAEKTVAVAEQGPHVAPQKATFKKGATERKDAPKGRNTAKRGMTKAVALKKEAKAEKIAAKRAPAKAHAPRAESKGAKIIEMMRRAKGATLAEIMKTTDWQAHSVRGYISTAAKKHGIKIESTRTEAGDRLYKITR
jgi:hypothetical protein